MRDIIKQVLREHNEVKRWHKFMQRILQNTYPGYVQVEKSGKLLLHKEVPIHILNVNVYFSPSSLMSRMHIVYNTDFQYEHTGHFINIMVRFLDRSLYDDIDSLRKILDIPYATVTTEVDNDMHYVRFAEQGVQEEDYFQIDRDGTTHGTLDLKKINDYWSDE
jgi:hypothetical protein